MTHIESFRYWGGWFARVTNAYGRVLYESDTYPDRRDARREAREWVRMYWRQR